MLQEVYQPVLNMVWLEAEIMNELNLIQLVRQQQRKMGMSIFFDQFSVDCTQQF